MQYDLTQMSELEHYQQLQQLQAQVLLMQARLTSTSTSATNSDVQQVEPFRFDDAT